MDERETTRQREGIDMRIVKTLIVTGTVTSDESDVAIFHDDVNRWHHARAMLL